MYNQKYIYTTTKGGYRLTPEGEALIRQYFPTTNNRVLIKKLGCANSTLYQLADKLGVKKDDAYKERMLHDGMLHARAAYVADKEANPERYRELYLLRGKRVKMMRRHEELRIMSGEAPRYNFYFAPAHSKECNKYRKRFNRRGYIPYERYSAMHWYFAPETKRDPALEVKAKTYGFKFSCFR